MIQITKPSRAPAILRDRGSRETAENCVEYDRDPDAFKDGSRKFNFNSKIYGAKSVKNALTRAQYDKCCFCESPVTQVAYGDVEHFRPKGGYRQTSVDPLGKPGYYWLSYDWNNLFFSCQICNQRHKGNLFPLDDSNRRAKSHHDDIADEAPLFVDPGAMNPEEFITFNEEQPIPINNNIIGRTTITALGLDRLKLNEARLEWLAYLKFFKNVLESRPGTPLAEEAGTFIERAKSNQSKYAAMARAFFG